MYYYIVNPAAGRGRSKALQDRIRARLDVLGIRGEWATTTAPGDATKMAAAAIAKGHTTIVAVGGDDTVNEVINGISGTTKNVAIGIIPLGHANRLANRLGITGWEQACDVLAARRLTSYSLIAAGQKYFLSTLSLGFETELDKAVETGVSGTKAKLGQLKTGLGRARSFTTLRARLKVDEMYQIECDLFSLSIANQKFLNPQLDNRLVVSLSDHPGHAFNVGRYVWQFLTNRGVTATEDTATTHFLADRVVIETNPPTGLMLDGKVAGRTPIAIRLTDRRIRFITEKVLGDLKEAVGHKKA